MGTIATVIALAWCFGIPLALTLAGGYHPPDHGPGPDWKKR